MGRQTARWTKGGTQAQPASTHLNAPGPQLLFCGFQVKGDGCTGIVDPEDREDLAIVQLYKQTRTSVGHARIALQEFRTEGTYLRLGAPSRDEGHNSCS